MSMNESEGEKTLDLTIPSDSKCETAWESPLHQRHTRAFSNDFVDDEEVDSDYEDFELASNSSWIIRTSNSQTEESSTTDEDGPFPLEEPVAPAIEYEHLKPWIKEHAIFLKAALDLLQERDKHAPTVGMMDPVTLKAGPLKKASILMKGIWKVKYVEIRRGMLSYYENLQNEQKLIRKDVPLQAQDCTVRAVKVHPSKAALQLTTNRRGGAIFELVVGGTKKLWMASSRDERQSWMQAIRNATVGGSLTTSNDHSDHRGRLRVVNPRSPFRHDLRLYLKMQSVLRNSSSQTEYIQGLGQLKKEKSSLQIPVKWIAKEQELLLQQQQQQHQLQLQPLNQQNQQQSQTQGVGGGGDISPLNGHQAFTEEEVDRSIEQLWRDLQRDSVSINGNVYRGDQGLGPKGIMGALAHRILQVSLTPSLLHVHSPTVPSVVSNKETPDEDQRNETIIAPFDDLAKLLAKGPENSKKASRKVTEEPSSLESSDSTQQPQIIGLNNQAPPSPVVARIPSQHNAADGNGSELPQPAQQWSDFSEEQALTYARDILLSGNRTRSGGDSYFCINTLFQNSELVVIVPSYEEVSPVKFTVTSDEAAIRRNDKAGWIKCHSKLQRGWKKLFFVLSEGILSYYERALPRPNGLRGQLHMSDASISVSKKMTKVKNDKTGEKLRPLYAISITTKAGKERSLAFDSVDRMLDWVYALECESKVTSKPTVANDPATRRLMRRFSTETPMSTDPDASNLLTAEQTTEKHAATLGVDLVKVRQRLANLSRKASPAVRVSVEASTEYKVSTTDPDGNDDKDTWALVRTTFHQSFRLTGGPSGRILRGEEVVRVAILKCQGDETEHDEVPASPRWNRKKNFFRSVSTNPDLPSPTAHEDIVAQTASDKTS